jgi:hypothetical protein
MATDSVIVDVPLCLRNWPSSAGQSGVVGSCLPPVHSVEGDRRVLALRIEAISQALSLVKVVFRVKVVAMGDCGKSDSRRRCARLSSLAAAKCGWGEIQFLRWLQFSLPPERDFTTLTTDIHI